MTVYGDSGYYISISKRITGTPSGPNTAYDTIYLYADEYEFAREFKIKIKQTPNGDSYSSSKGKKVREIELKKCIIIDDDGNQTTNTEALNNKITLLDEWSDLTETFVYLIITSKIDSVNLALSRNSSGATDYMKGYVTRIRGRPLGNIYMLDISFKESTLI